MAAADLPSISPSYASAVQYEAKILRNDFGDGYAQRATPGLNSVGQKWNLQWDVISGTDADTLCDFFELQAGVEIITWTPPRQSVELQWICTSWNRTITYPSHDSVTATLEQVFDLT